MYSSYVLLVSNINTTPHFLNLLGDPEFSECLVRWLPEQLCSLLHLPLSLSEWLIPSGLCCRRQCRRPFFKHFYSRCVALGSCRDCLNLCDSFVEQGDKPDNLSVCIRVCSLQCMQNLQICVLFVRMLITSDVTWSIPFADSALLALSGRDHFQMYMQRQNIVQ